MPDKKMTKEHLNKYNFGEQLQEDDKKVIITEKYWQSKEKAIEMIEADYGLTVADFWILKTMSRSREYVIYNGLIISHNGCLKINDWLVKQGNGFKSECLSDPILTEWNGARGLRQVYKETPDEAYVANGKLVVTGSDLYEVGEISTDNLKNPYPFAMLLKRTFDRVVLKKSKLAYFGVYSEEEADEFKQVNNQ